jgi:D-beta-D-heptose 7-phosphate kinase/D-beta-D-heptose 1-phosphate adenosyltransferase
LVRNQIPATSNQKNLLNKDKIKKLRELIKIVDSSKKRGEKVVFTNGCFDILHLGHIKYLEKAKSLGNKLIVALNSDVSVRKLKGEHRPIFSEQDRAGLIAALECVDYVIIFAEATPLGLIKALKPDALVKGGDWRKQDIIGKDVIESYGGRLVTVDFVKGYSTSLIIDKIRKGK